MAESSIFHIAEPARWKQAQGSGSYTASTRGAELDDVGFIHCSFDRQVEQVADLVYGDWLEPLLLLEVSPESVSAEIREESMAGGVEVFPHIYGPLPTSAVTSVRPLVRRAGRWRLPSAG